MNKQHAYLTFLIASALGMGTAHAAAPEFDWNVEAGIGFNDNVYRAPNDTYIDYSVTGTPTVVPDRKSGFFIPLGFEVEANYAYSKTTDVIAKLDSYADFHLGSDLKNKDKTLNKIDLGIETQLNKVKSKKNKLYAGIFYDVKDQTYYDRDTGTTKVSGASDIADKYSYNANGLQLKYRGRTTTPTYSVSAEIGSRDYADTIVSTDQDYDYINFGGDVDFALTKSTELTLDYSREVQDYSERTARDLNGSLLTTNPLLEYTYQTLGASINHDFSDQWSAKLSFDHITREDNYLGYNDYTSEKVRLTVKNKTDKLSNKFALAYMTRDYDKAFAFDEPTQANKTYDTLSLSLKSEYQHTEQRSIWLEAKHYEADTNDLRYNYDNKMIMVGVKYQK